MKKLFLLIALVMGYELCANTYIANPNCKLYDKSNGLNNNTVSAIFQDEAGYLWLGTDIGLTKSDGYSFHHYYTNDIGGKSVTGIIQLDENLLWCSSNSYSKPFCFNISAGKELTLAGLDDEFLKSLKDLGSAAGKLYALKDSRLVELVPEYSGSTVNLKSAYSSFEAPVERVFYSSSSGSSCLYLLSGGDLVIFNTASGKTEFVELLSLGIEEVSGVAQVEVYGDNVFLFGPYMMPVCYNLNSRKWVTLDTENPIVGIQEIDSHNYIIATWNSIDVLTFGGDDIVSSQYSLTALYNNKSVYANIFRNRIKGMYYDKTNQVLWVGLSGRGLIKVAFGGDKIKSIDIPSDIKTITGVEQDWSGHIWLTTRGQGVFRSTTDSLSSKMDFKLWKGVAEGTHVMYQDELGNLLFGGDMGSIVKYNPVTGKQENIQIRYSSNDGTITADNINAIYLNTRNRLWVAADNGLFVCEAGTRETLAYMPKESRTGKVTAICQDGGGNMWIGTEGGVFMAQIQGSVINLTSGFEESANVAASKVLTLYLNNFNQLYVSYEDKTMHIDARSGEVMDVLMLRRDYSSGNISCITDDGSGCTWLGTSEGVVMVNNNNLESYLYELPESYTDVYRLRKGELLWATSNGLVYFNPEEIKRSVVDSKFVVTDVEVNYTKLEDRFQDFEAPLYFRHDENNLHVYVSDMRFGTHMTKIEYRLLPLEHTWKSTYGNCVELSNLKQGSYTLQMRNPNITGEEPPVTEMKFIIRPLWIFSFWGILTIVVAFIVIMYLGYLYTLYRLRNRKNLSAIESQLLSNVNEHIEREERAKLRANLRHEIVQKLRTPISMIIAPLKEISSDPSISRDVRVKSRLALQNSVIVQEICTRLEDLFILEKDEVYKVGPYEISRISNSTVYPLQDVFNNSTVKVYFDKDNNVDKILWVDIVRISFLLRSLLMHVLRYLEYSGQMWLDVKEITKDGKSVCVFIIKTDKIAGIKKDNRFSLCKDYNETINQKLLGWQFLQYVATMHGADVIFDESVENGLELSLYLPFMGKEDWEGKKNVEIVEPVVSEDSQDVFENLVIDGNVDNLEGDEEEVGEVESGNVKLLVIEDNADIRLYMKVMFSKMYNVLFAEDGEKGVELAKAEKPNLILTDIMMPGMDGYEVLRIVKEDAVTCHIPVILLTALTGEEEIIKGFDLGADDFITKPFNPDILRAKVRQLVKGRRELKQLYTKRLVSTGATILENEEVVKEEDPLIAKINDLVVANMKNPDFNVKELASMLFMSQPTLYRKVKQITGYTIIEVVRTVRLRQAAELLKTKRYSIQEVSELVGYNDVPTFRKHFIALYGSTPSSFMGSN